jgi:hypothetical protein
MLAVALVWILAQQSGSDLKTHRASEALVESAKEIGLLGKEALADEELRKFIEVTSAAFDSGTPLDAFQRLVLFAANLPAKSNNPAQLEPKVLCDFWETLNKRKPFNDPNNLGWQNFLQLNGEFISEFLYGTKDPTKGSCGKGLLAFLRVREIKKDPMQRDIDVVFSKDFKLRNEKLGVLYWLKNSKKTKCPEGHQKNGQMECPFVTFRITRPDPGKIKAHLSDIKNDKVTNNYRDDILNGEDQSKVIGTLEKRIAQLRSEIQRSKTPALEKSLIETLVELERAKVKDYTRKSKVLIDEIVSSTSDFDTMSIQVSPDKQGTEFWMESPSGWDVNISEITLTKSTQNQYLMTAGGSVYPMGFSKKVSGAIGGKSNEF